LQLLAAGIETVLFGDYGVAVGWNFLREWRVARIGRLYWEYFNEVENCG